MFNHGKCIAECKVPYQQKRGSELGITWVHLQNFELQSLHRKSNNSQLILFKANNYLS
jgi:hypothetical protein